MGHQKTPVRGQRKRAHGDGLETDQGGAPLSGRKRSRMVHAAALRAHELLAFGQNFHQLLEGGALPPGLKQREAKSYDQGGGGKASINFTSARKSDTIAASTPLPAPHLCAMACAAART